MVNEQKKFRVKFIGATPPNENWIEATTGSTLLDVALDNHIEIDHACGGVAACSTCHIVIQEGFNTCPAPEEAEEDMLDKAPGLTPLSRLACQCRPNGSKDLVIKIPSWNRNLVRE